MRPFQVWNGLLVDIQRWTDSYDEVPILLIKNRLILSFQSCDNFTVTLKYTKIIIVTVEFGGFIMNFTKLFGNFPAITKMLLYNSKDTKQILLIVYLKISSCPTEKPEGHIFSRKLLLFENEGSFLLLCHKGKQKYPFQLAVGGACNSKFVSKWRSEVKESCMLKFEPTWSILHIYV